MNPKVLVVGDSSVIHTGFGRVVKEITMGLYNTGKYDIKTIGWFHWHGQKNQEVVPYEIISTRPSKDDMYAQHTFNEVVAVFKPDMVLAVGDLWMTETMATSPYRSTYRLYTYCFSGDTDVLTPSGIKNIKDIKIGDMVYGLNKKTGENEITMVKEIQHNPSDKPFISIKNQHINFLITDEHRFPVLKDGIIEDVTALEMLESKEEYELAPFSGIRGIEEDLFPIWKYVDGYLFIKATGKNQFNEMRNILETYNIKYEQHGNHGGFKIGTWYKVLMKDVTQELIRALHTEDGTPIGRLYINGCYRGGEELPCFLPTMELFSLIGWFLSEGCIPQNGEHSLISISQDKIVNPGKREEIKQLIIKLGFKYCEKEDSFNIYGRAISSFIKLFGTNSWNHDIPSFIFNYDRKYLLEIEKSYMKGDGCKSRFSSVCQNLIDKMRILALHNGKRLGVEYVSKALNENSRDCISVGFGSRVIPKIYPRNISRTNILEDSYCITTGLDTVIAGRNGLFNNSCQCPIDGSPLKRSWHDLLMKPDKIVAYGNFGMNEILKIGIPMEKLMAIPHGVDVNTFKPMDRKALKEKYKAQGLYVVGFVSRNQPRKNIPKLMQAFFLFAGEYITCNACGNTFFQNLEYCPCCKAVDFFHGKPKDEARLYLHMAAKEEFGWDIPELIARYDLSKKVIIPSDMQVGAGVSSDTLAELYNVFDVSTLPTMGEGFGLSIIESMACGTPVVVTDYSGHVDFCKPCAELIKVSDYTTEIGSNIDRAIVDTIDYVMRLDKLYYDDTEVFNKKWGTYLRDNYPESQEVKITGSKAREMLGEASVIQANNYSWDKIIPQWDTLISSTTTTNKKNVKTITERA